MTQPHFGTVFQTKLRSFRLSNHGQETDITAILVSTAQDAQAGNSINNPNRATILRAGLVLGKITATGKYKEYNNASGDGSEVAAAILMQDVDMLIPGTATPQDTGAVIATIGEFDQNQLIYLTGSSGLTGMQADFLAAGSHIVLRA